MLIQEEPIFRRFNAGAELLKELFLVDFEDGGLIFDASTIFIFTKNSLPSHLEAGYNPRTSFITVHDVTLMPDGVMMRAVKKDFYIAKIINAFRLVEFETFPGIVLIVIKEELIQ